MTKPEFNRYQLCEIRKGREYGVDVSIYAKPEFTDGQMYEIRKGLEDDLDVSVYARHEFSSYQMTQMRMCLSEETPRKHIEDIQSSIASITNDYYSNK